MKSGHKKIRSTQLQDFEALKERIDKWKLPSEPFDWQTRGAAVTETHCFYNEAFRMWKQNPHDAELSQLRSRASDLWSRAIDAAYPASLIESWNKLRRGDAAGMEDAVQFLEDDPIFFRTGYFKAKLTRYIKPGMITPNYAVRLRNIILNIADKRDDRDFRAFCRLARKGDAPELRAALTHRLTHSDSGIRRRPRWVLEALEQPQ